MLETCRLMWKNELIGIITLNRDFKHDRYSFSTLIDNKKHYPPEFLRNDNITSEDIEDFFKYRVIQEDNQGLQIVLEKLNLLYWDAWNIAMLTHGVVFWDYWWVTQDENDKFEDIHILG